MRLVEMSHAILIGKKIGERKKFLIKVLMKAVDVGNLLLCHTLDRTEASARNCLELKNAL